MWSRARQVQDGASRTQVNTSAPAPACHHPPVTHQTGCQEQQQRYLPQQQHNLPQHRLQKPQGTIQSTRKPKLRRSPSGTPPSTCLTSTLLPLLLVLSVHVSATSAKPLRIALMESPSSKLALSKVPIPLEEGSQKDPKNPIPLEEERDPKKSKGPSRARKAVVPRGAKYSPASQLKYYGGSLITVASPVHFVYYGRWKNGTQGKGDPAQNLLRKFMASLAAGQPAGPGSVAAWWQLNSLYAQRNGQRVTKRVFLASEHYDWYSQGTSLKDDSGQVYQVVKRLFDKGALKPNPAAMYIVLTTPDVKVGVGQTGFCKAYCGWHDTKAYKAKAGGSVDVFYGFIGDPSTQCLGTGCGMQWGSGLSPNQQPGIDSMISTIGHELAEIATDPDTVTGWLTADTVEGYENADLCQFTVLGSKTAAFANGMKYKYNLEGVSGTRFFVQSNYDPVKGMCAMNP